MNAQPLKTAASCTEHGERTYTCINAGCGQQVARKACETWHMDQCDVCIVKYFYEKAVRDADTAMKYAIDADPVSRRAIDWHQANVLAWRVQMERLGLIK